MQAIFAPISQPTGQSIPFCDHDLGPSVGGGQQDREVSKLELLFSHPNPPTAAPLTISEHGAQNFVPQMNWAHQQRPILGIGGAVPVQIPADVPPSYRSPPQPQQQAGKPEPKSAEGGSRRPVRQSRLKRNFNLVDLSDGDDDIDDNEASGGGRKQTKRRNSLQQQQAAVPTVPMHHGRSGKAYPAAAPAQNPLKAIKTHPHEHIMSHDPLPVLYPCPLDIFCPRRLRSVSKARPRTSRASINRLKQAAHGTLPLGGGDISAFEILKRDLGDEENSEKEEDDIR